MAHILAKLGGVKPDLIKQILARDASEHAREGLYLEHLWRDVDDENEVVCLFRTTNLDHAKQFINRVHTQTLKEDPDANLPHMTFLREQ